METLEVKKQIDKNNEQIKAILFLLHSHFQDLSIQLETSYNLLDIGEKTQLSRTVEKSVNNPVQNLFEISFKIDKQVKSVINKFAESFFRKRNEIINSVYRNITTNNGLSYSIILKQDTSENRNLIFDFNDKYDLVEISEKFPIVFHFIPLELESELKNVKEISIR